NSQPLGARADDLQVVGDAELAAGQRDGAVTGRRGEADRVGTGAVVGVEDRLPQGSGAAVGEVPDREGARHGPVLQPFDAQPGGQGPLTEPSGVMSVLGAGRPEEGTCGSQPGGQTHGKDSLERLVCDPMETPSFPARRPSAGAVPGR